MVRRICFLKYVRKAPLGAMKTRTARGILDYLDPKGPDYKGR